MKHAKPLVILASALLISLSAQALTPTEESIIKSSKYSPQLVELAKNGNARAQNNLGIAYLKGLGVDVDLTQAVYWFQKAAEQGRGDALANLGAAYLNGAGVPQDFTKARELFEQAAERNNQGGTFNLATMYLKGQGVPRDLKKSFDYALRAANFGSNKSEIVNDEGTMEDQAVTARAEMFVAMCYRSGQGVEKDLSKFIEFMRRAAQREDPLAAMGLGLCYENGEGVPASLTTAEDYYKAAAEGGQVEAQYLLGRRYAEGDKFEKNRTLAIKYLDMALNSPAKMPPMVKADILLTLAGVLDTSTAAKDKALARKYRAEAAKLPAPDRQAIDKMLF